MHKCLQPLVYDLFWHKISGALCHNHPLELLYGLLPAILAFPNNKETHHALSHLPINSLTFCSTCSQPSCSFWQLFVDTCFVIDGITKVIPAVIYTYTTYGFQFCITPIQWIHLFFVPTQGYLPGTMSTNLDNCATKSSDISG